MDIRISLFLLSIVLDSYFRPRKLLISKNSSRESHIERNLCQSQQNVDHQLSLSVSLFEKKDLGCHHESTNSCWRVWNKVEAFDPQCTKAAG
nr:hypothetical protein CFP56_46221 [Quercus suber]